MADGRPAAAGEPADADRARAAAALLRTNFAARRGERVLFVSDGAKPGFARALADVCAARGHPFRHEALAGESSYEPPAAVAAALLRCDVALLATARSYTHSEAASAARAAGVRLATSAGVSEAQLVAGLGADYERIAARAERLAARLSEAARVRVRAPGGTELEFSVVGLRGHAETGLYSRPGAIGNLPAGEAAIGLNPSSARGVVAIDGSYPGLGRLERPLRLIVEGGRALRAEGAQAAFFERLWAERGDGVRSLAEFGIGANPSLALAGHPLIDEKVAGTVHFGFGNDLNFGGSNGVPYHADGTVLRPRVELDGEVLDLTGR